MDNPLISANAPAIVAKHDAELDGATDPAAFGADVLAGLNSPVLVDKTGGTGGAGTDLSAAEVQARASQQFTVGKSDITGLPIADLTGLAPEPTTPQTQAEKDLVTLASDAVKLYDDRVRVDLKGKTLEAFIEGLEQLPKNEIRLNSIVAVGYEQSTKKLIFFQS